MSGTEGAPDASADGDGRIAAAVEVLRAGGLVAFPTETVYGLGADASDEAAVRRVFAVKGRPADHPLIVHLGTPELLERWSHEPGDAARRLAAGCWPGPLTLLVHRSLLVTDAVTGGRPTVGLRVPAHPLALALLRRFGGGVAAPSANRFGHVSPTTAEHVRADLGDAVDLVLDGGPCPIGVESTIVDCTTEPPEILRHGGIPAERVEAVLGRSVRHHAAGPSRASGMLPSHYAPRCTLELVGDAESAWVRCTQHREAGRWADVLDPGPDLEAYARHLYAWLRDADDHGLDVLVVVPPPEVGLGVAINDRLRKAAAPRPPGVRSGP